MRTSRVEGAAVATARTRGLMEKAFASGLTPSESEFLRAQLSAVAARIERVNQRAGRPVAQLSPYAKLLSDASTSAAVAV